MATRPKNILKKLRERDGDNCWLCGQPCLFDGGKRNPLYASWDHYVPRKWGGNNTFNNSKLAHKRCNEAREKLFPETMKFTMQELETLTNRHSISGNLSKKATRAAKKLNLMQSGETAHHPSRPFE